MLNYKDRNELMYVEVKVTCYIDKLTGLSLKLAKSHHS